MFTEDKKLLLGSVPNKAAVNELESFANDFTGRTTEMPAMKMDYYPNIMHHEFALCQTFTSPPYTQVLLNMVAQISGLI